MPAIPERNPIGDTFAGLVLEVEGKTILALQPLTGAMVLYSGSFVIRYGVRYLGKPHLSLVPGILALDYGEMLTGEEAWNFLLNKSNLYPRADVVGYRNDGADEMLAVKWLDLALPLVPLVYADTKATKPLAQPVALIATDTTGIAPRILEHLPRYVSLADWLADQ
ncbi:MAG: hypothetical protein H7X77_02160 [Anaerolineae bacterium]|nr:hypothetical protein [Anaerolineae bacterium]